MASHHMCCKVISRGQGRSATAAAAYRAAERICDRRTGLEHEPVTDRARENEQIMERNALVKHLK